MTVSIKQLKPKLVGTVDYVIKNLEADTGIPRTEIVSLKVARELLSKASIQQIADAVERVRINEKSKSLEGL
jgi:hypothetical protein